MEEPLSKSAFWYLLGFLVLLVSTRMAMKLVVWYRDGRVDML